MPAPQPFMMAPDEVHVWTIDLTLPLPAAWAASLNAAEQARASRFVTAPLQSTFRRARGGLRAVLAQYTGQNAAAITLVDGAYGKPALAGGEFEFNLSHSGALALLAVAPAHAPVGIDIEAMHDRHVDVVTLFDMVCNDGEKAHLASLDGDARRRAFYALWTRKEAYIKALGLGLQVDLHTVAFTPGAQAGSWSVARNDADNSAASWDVRTLDTAPDYAASICLPRPGMRIVPHHTFV